MVRTITTTVMTLYYKEQGSEEVKNINKRICRRSMDTGKDV